MCCAPKDYRKGEINGGCPSCGVPTVDGDSYEGCSYSSVICEVCGHAPCDESC